MKKLFLSIVLAIFSSILIGQTNLTVSIETNKIDEFSGVHKKISNDIVFGDSTHVSYIDVPSYPGGKYAIGECVHLRFAHITKDSLNNYYIYIYPGNDIGCAGSVNNYLSIRLCNGDFITLNEDRAKVNCSSSTASSIFLLSSDEVEILSKNEIDMIRFNRSETYMDLKVPDKELFIKAIKILD